MKLTLSDYEPEAEVRLTVQERVQFRRFVCYPFRRATLTLSVAEVVVRNYTRRNSHSGHK